MDELLATFINPIRDEGAKQFFPTDPLYPYKSDLFKVSEANKYK